jgi:hypothetical protein
MGFFFFLIHMQTINWWLGYFSLDFLDNVIHSFIIHSFIIHSFIHSFIIHSSFGGDHTLCSNCLSDYPRSPQYAPKPDKQATHQPNYTNSVIVSVLVKVQKSTTIGGRKEGRKEYEHHSHPPTHSL